MVMNVAPSHLPPSPSSFRIIVVITLIKKNVGHDFISHTCSHLQSDAINKFLPKFTMFSMICLLSLTIPAECVRVTMFVTQSPFFYFQNIFFLIQ